MRNLFLTMMIAAGSVVPAWSQPLPADDQPGPIVVQGMRNPDKEVGRFVDALTNAPAFGQLSRFNWAVCPAVVGLGETQNAAIAKRMADVAAAAAIPAAKPGCKPNALLLVTGNKAELIDRLASKYPAYFRGVSPAAIRRMKRNPSPAAAWHVEGRLDSDGLEAQHDVDGRTIVKIADTPARLGTSSRPHFVASVVVVERQAVTGLSVVQLADYAAMRSFARTDPRDLQKTSAPTILAALEAPASSLVPVTLTQWDLAFLKSLYASNPNVLATSQRNDMKEIVRKDLGPRKGKQ